MLDAAARTMRRQIAVDEPMADTYSNTFYGRKQECMRQIVDLKHFILETNRKELDNQPPELVYLVMRHMDFFPIHHLIPARLQTR